ncbi:MAG: PAN domain-containing protein, partial [Myxococcota bacterium]
MSDNAKLIILTWLEGFDSLTRLLLANTPARYIASGILNQTKNLEDLVLDDLQEGGRNVITSKDQAFASVCCTPGAPNLAALPTVRWCEMHYNTPGTDAVFEDYVSVKYGDYEELYTPASSFLKEAAESAAKCAEACKLSQKCIYFTYDNRYSRADTLCILYSGVHELQRNEGTPDDYADAALTLPGFVSGSPPLRRAISLGAVVVASPGIVEANLVPSTPDGSSDAASSSAYQATYQLSIGSLPLRGAVWASPKIGPGFEEAQKVAEFTPRRVIWYPSDADLEVNVTVTFPGGWRPKESEK